MSYRRDHRASRAALFDSYNDLEDGSIRSSRPPDNSEHENDKAIGSLHDRASFLKKITGDIHGEVENQNRMLNYMGYEMDASRGVMSGTMDRYRMVFEKKSNRRMCKLVAYFIVSFIMIYYFIRFLIYFMHG